MLVEVLWARSAGEVFWGLGTLGAELCRPAGWSAVPPPPPSGRPPPASRLHFPAAPAGGGGGGSAGGRGRRCERRRGRCSPGTRAGDHGVRRAGESTLNPGDGGRDDDDEEGASLERAGPTRGKGGRGGEIAGGRLVSRGRAGSAAPRGARGPMRRPGDHGLQDQVSAAGPGSGRRGRAKAAGRGLRGGLVAGT